MRAMKEVEAQAGQLPEDGNIDKIRDILFGVQVRDFERKFSKLEERFGKEIEGLPEDTRQKLDNFEEFVSKELNTLTEKIDEEQDLRSDAVKQVTSELQKASIALDKKLTKFGERRPRTKPIFALRSIIIYHIFLAQKRSAAESSFDY